MQIYTRRPLLVFRIMYIFILYTLLINLGFIYSDIYSRDPFLHGSVYHGFQYNTIGSWLPKFVQQIVDPGREIGSSACYFHEKKCPQEETSR